MAATLSMISLTTDAMKANRFSGLLMIQQPERLQSQKFQVFETRPVLKKSGAKRNQGLSEKVVERPGIEHELKAKPSLFEMRVKSW